MPRFFFDTEDGQRFPDEEGTELPNIDAAKVAASAVLGEMLKEPEAALWDTGSLRVIVKNDSGLDLFTLEAAVVLAPALKSRAWAADSLAPPTAAADDGARFQRGLRDQSRRPSEAHSQSNSEAG